jgi:predicted phage gp36 major capsid-like protein
MKQLVRFFNVGAALNALMDFLRALVKANIPAFTSSRLLAIFLEQEAVMSPTRTDVNASHHKQSFYSLAKCIATISVGSGPNEALGVASRFIEDLKSPGLVDTQVVIALLSIGEIGRFV